MRSSLQAALEKEKQAALNVRELGIEIAEIRTYWKYVPDVTGGAGDLVLPYIRLSVKNVSGRNITGLKAKAAFELLDKKELLGDGSIVVIGAGDPPLKPGYSTEVAFGCSSGFRGYAAVLTRPKTSADLYLQTSEGDERFVKTIRITRDIRY